MELEFRQSGPQVSLLQAANSAISLQNATFTLNGCQNPRIRIDHRPAGNTTADRELDLALEVHDFRITEILLTQPETKRGTVLTIRGAGHATSIQQGGRELMPRWVDELISQPYTERELKWILLGLLALFLFKVASQALDVIAKIIIPD
jgi:hypothetical protein